jgi:translation elongation factor EF-Ts
MPAAESPLQEEARRKAMPAAEAVKVLHLSEASQAEIEKRYNILVTANGDSGNSQYVHDKIVHARDVALDHLTRGTLKKHIKVKREDPITEPPKSEL